MANAPTTTDPTTTDLTTTPCCSVLDAPLDEAGATTLAAGFRALADPVRVRLLSLIAANPDGEACACELLEVLDRSQPTVSHHLKLLTEAGLVTREKRGTWAWFRVVPERLEELRSALAPGPGSTTPRPSC